MDKRKEKILKKLEEKKRADLDRQKTERYADKLKKIRALNSYVQNKVKGAYYLARCNALASQINLYEKFHSEDGKPSRKPEFEWENIEPQIEKTDGVTKTQEFLVSEYHLTKVSAASCHREAYFALMDLKKLGMTDKEIDDMANDIILGPIVRKEYDDTLKREQEAQFVPT